MPWNSFDEDSSTSISAYKKPRFSFSRVQRELKREGLLQPAMRIARAKGTTLRRVFSNQGARLTPMPEVRTLIARLFLDAGWSWNRVSRLYNQDHATLINNSKRFAMAREERVLPNVDVVVLLLEKEAMRKKMQAEITALRVEVRRLRGKMAAVRRLVEEGDGRDNGDGGAV